MDEHEAIRRLKQHDLRGLESLVHDHQLEAVRVAMLVTRDRALAEDVVQSSFVRVCEKIGQFDEGRPFRPWFLRIVTNAALKAVTRGRRDISYDMLAAGATAAGGRLLAADDPQEHAERSERAGVLRAAVDGLSPEERAAVVLHYYLGFKVSEIAGEGGRPVGTVKRRLHDARIRLRALLARSLGHESRAEPARSVPIVESRGQGG
jgi:RNA polymerase sigma-70 factor (ECF subfamily)